MVVLKKIRVAPLAAESLGVRSMCTYVETPDARLLLDAGVSLCPNRFGLPPHPREFEAIIEARKRIAEAAGKVGVVTISHYHYDHYTPTFEDWLVNWTEREETAKQIYQDKLVLAKNPREDVNFSQRERGWIFKKTEGTYAKNVVNADGKTFTFGDTILRFSEPVFHGPEGSEMGWVLMVTIEFEDERFMFAPDVQGPMSNRPRQVIEKENPQLLMIGGPPVYLSPERVSEKQIELALKNLADLIAIVPRVILDHHVIRDENWQMKALDVLYNSYKSGTAVQTAAEFVGRRTEPLEAWRRRNFKISPPSREFEKWMKTDDETKRHTKPPL